MTKRIEVTAGFVAVICLLAWMDLWLCLRFLAAAAVHELGHLIVMRICHVLVYRIHVRIAGAVIVGNFAGYRQERWCAAAGPAASGVLALLTARCLPELAIVSVLLGAFNLLPLYPMDGGRFLRAALLSRWDTLRVERLLSGTAFVVCTGLMVCACWLTVVMQAGIWPIFAALAFLWRMGDASAEGE